MDPIERPDNVIMPRYLDAKIQARRLLDPANKATKADMTRFLEQHGQEVPKGASEDDVRNAVLSASAAGNIMGRSSAQPAQGTTAAATASTAAAPANSAKGGGK